MKNLLLVVLLIALTGCSTIAKPLSDYNSQMISTAPCGKDKIEYVSVGNYRSSCNGFTFYETRKFMAVVKGDKGIIINATNQGSRYGLGIYSPEDIADMFASSSAGANIFMVKYKVKKYCDLVGMEISMSKTGTNRKIEDKLSAAVAILDNFDKLKEKYCAYESRFSDNYDNADKKRRSF